MLMSRNQAVLPTENHTGLPVVNSRPGALQHQSRSHGLRAQMANQHSCHVQRPQARPASVGHHEGRVTAKESLRDAGDRAWWGTGDSIPCRDVLTRVWSRPPAEQALQSRPELRLNQGPSWAHLPGGVPLGQPVPVPRRRGCHRRQRATRRVRGPTETLPRPGQGPWLLCPRPAPFHAPPLSWANVADPAGPVLTPGGGLLCLLPRQTPSSKKGFVKTSGNGGTSLLWEPRSKPRDQ